MPADPRMLPDSDRVSPQQLHWCHANRQTRSRTKPLGEAVAKLAQSVSRAPSGDLAIFEAIRQMVDDPFRRMCRFGGVRSGEVIILVDPAHARYHSTLRTRWHLPLWEHLKRTCRGSTIRRIQFKPGTDGVAF